MSNNEPQLPASAVLPEEILRQRELGWPDFHPEDYCHRCGRRNPSWWVDGKQWRTATEHRDRGYIDILCPPCFVEEYERATGTTTSWALVCDIEKNRTTT